MDKIDDTGTTGDSDDLNEQQRQAEIAELESKLDAVNAIEEAGRGNEQVVESPELLESLQNLKMTFVNYVEGSYPDIDDEQDSDNLSADLSPEHLRDIKAPEDYEKYIRHLDEWLLKIDQDEKDLFVKYRPQIETLIQAKITNSYLFNFATRLTEYLFLKRTDEENLEKLDREAESFAEMEYPCTEEEIISTAWGLVPEQMSDTLTEGIEKIKEKYPDQFMKSEEE